MFTDLTLTLPSPYTHADALYVTLHSVYRNHSATTLGIAPRVSHDSVAPAASHRRTQHDMRTPCTPSFTRTAIRSVHTHAQSLCSHSSMHTPNTQHIRPRPAPGTRDHRRVHGGPNSPSGTPPCAPPCPPPCGPQPGAGSGASRAGMPAGRGMAASGSGGGPAADGALFHTSARNRVDVVLRVPG